MKQHVKVVFASGTDDLNARLVERMKTIYPALPLCVVSEFPPADRSLRWVRYQVDRPLRHNLARCRSAFRACSIRLAGVMLTPNVPLRRLRLLALLLAPLRVIAFNEDLNHFMLHPRSARAILRHALWRAKNFVQWHLGRKRAASQAEAERTPEAERITEAEAPAIRVFGGRAARPKVLIATPYLPFPLSHGGAVRMYNLMRRAARDFDQILIAFTESADPPAQELLEICAEVVLVNRAGSHLRPARGRPEAVEEFCSAAFAEAVRGAVRVWRPAVAQLEFTQMAQYAEDCAPARTILVEHDITFDLYAQLLALGDDWDLRRELKLWRSFETAAWQQVDRVVVMSERDRAMVGAPAVALPNGVDLERYRPAQSGVEDGRLLFIGSFAHLPNLLALEFFLNEAWPRLTGARLHVIAGARHEFHLERSGLRMEVRQPGVEIEGFVEDVRPAYERAAVVIAPLRASAGTNIKILEAMAMGKAIVSTRAGVNGLDLAAGEDYVLAKSAEEFAAETQRLIGDAEARARLGAAARKRVERDYNWDVIAAAQGRLYAELNELACVRSSRGG